MFLNNCLLVFTAILTLTKICASAEISNLDDLLNIRIVCYYGSWSAYNTGIGKCTPEDIDPQLCTHLMYAFGGITKDMVFQPFDNYLDIDLGGYANFTRLKDYNKDLKTLLALGGWKEGGVRFGSIAADSKKRTILIKNSIAYLRKHNFDGLNLDWQYPYLKDRNNYLALIKELHEAYDSESNTTGRPRLLLTITLPTLKDHISRGYDVPNLIKYVDWMNVLTYDYHNTKEPEVNHHSKLYAVDEEFDYELNANYTINTYIASGAESHKLVLGIPTFGRTFELINSSMTDIGSPANGSGLPGAQTAEKGYLAYYEICDKIKNDGWIVNNPNPKAMGPYAYKDNQWVGYDDEDIVKRKSQFAAENKLGGIYFWVLDHDDCSGSCHGERFPLIKAAKEAFLLLNAIKNLRKSTTTDSNLSPTTAFAPTKKDETEFTIMQTSTTSSTFSKDTESVITNPPKYFVNSRRRNKFKTASTLPIQLTTPEPPQIPSLNEVSAILKIVDPVYIYLKSPPHLSEKLCYGNTIQHGNDNTEVVEKDYVKYFGDNKTLNQFQDFIKGPGGIEKLRAFLNTEETTTPVSSVSASHKESSEMLNTHFNDNQQIKPMQEEKSGADLRDGASKQFHKEEFKKSGTLNVVVNINL